MLVSKELIESYLPLERTLHFNKSSIALISTEDKKDTDALQHLQIIASHNTDVTDLHVQSVFFPLLWQMLPLL